MHALENFHIVIYPLLSPDGYEYSRDHDRFWRKNRNPNTKTFNPFNCQGVDLNRNYDIDWDIGNSLDQCSIIYAGISAFSEPESRAHR